MHCTMQSKSIVTNLTPTMFWESANILITKPHVINKRLWGCKIWFRVPCKPNTIGWEIPSTCTKLREIVSAQTLQQQTVLLQTEMNVKHLPDALFTTNEDLIEVILVELLPKCYTDSQAYQLVCLNKYKTEIKFFNVSPESCNQNLCPDFSYMLQLQQNNVTLTAECDEASKSYIWLTVTLLQQFIKWGTESAKNVTKSFVCNESLSLVSKDEYYEKYNHLKFKYGKEMVKIWPECTDPSKFVYEDVAIAAYLLLLWDTVDSKGSKKTFVDLGCGNGLLVYILTQEGHEGIGIDVRKRNIWDVYPSNVKLEEKTIVPSNISLFPNTDWIIGNHSDELTPWIPVIAARSSYRCNFFLLPCCAYNFDGTKYQRKNSSKSQYNDYLEYVKQLCQECGFNVDTDRLKIPSTKRICFVGIGRVYSEDKHMEYSNKIENLIKQDTHVNKENELWIKDFKARESVERVRNCTQLDHNVVNSIVTCISNYLLEGCSSAREWSIGKTVEINELIQLIPQDQLNILKSECGGIQTLMKNKHHIFKVQNGKVQLRYPKTIEEVSKNTGKNKQSSKTINVQQNPCWFFNNHPQGCPLSDTDCSYLHINKK